MAPGYEEGEGTDLGNGGGYSLSAESNAGRRETTVDDGT